MKQRNQYLDILRGIAIILMVFGHCLQYGNGTEFIKSSGFFYNRLFQVIYSFHMPLFMLLSGYLFFYTVGRYQKTREFLKNRWRRIVLPIIGWQTFHYLVKMVGMIMSREEISTAFFVKYVRSWFTDIWFLLAILYCSLIIFIVRKYCKDSVVVYALIFILSFITPDSMPNIYLYKYMYPFFLSGYFFAGYLDKGKDIISQIRLKYLFAGTMVVFAILFRFWDIDAYIYITGYTLIGKDNAFRQFVIDVYRILIGFVGSAVAVSGSKIVYEWLTTRITTGRLKRVNDGFWHVIAEIGRNSLCIYILSSEMVHWFLEAYSDYYHFSYVWTVVETSILIAVTYFVSIFIRKISVLNKLMLGGK